jgi:hypothetical protein
MRKGLALLACALGVVSILVTARYGWKQADIEVDQWIAAIMYGSISLCAFFFDSVAVLVWFRGARKTGAFLGAIACLAFVVTFSNSLGGIVSRADAVQAHRQAVSDSVAGADRWELKRLQEAMAALGKFTPTDEEAVKAARRAADIATNNRTIECNKRGPNCRQRELDDEAAARALASATSAKATTDRAKTLEGQIAAVQARLDAPKEAVGHANPLGAALANMIGSGADVLTAWQQAIIALVFELCLVGMMVGYTVLGEVSKPGTAEPEDPAPIRMPELARPKLVSANPAGSVAKVMTPLLEPHKGSRVEMGDIYGAYVKACQKLQVRALALDEFVDALATFCRATKIRTKKLRSHIYLMDVQLEPATGTTRSTPLPAC